MDFTISVTGEAGCQLRIIPREQGSSREAFIGLDPDVAWTAADLRKMAVSFEAAARMLTGGHQDAYPRHLPRLLRLGGERRGEHG
jgi:hypothetical protein